MAENNGRVIEIESTILTVHSERDGYTWYGVAAKLCGLDLVIERGVVQTLSFVMPYAEQRQVRDFTNSRMVVDATRPYDWKDKFPRVNAPSQEIARKAREKFGYLLKP